MNVLCSKDNFLEKKLDSFVFYNLLPIGGKKVVADNVDEPVSKLAEKLVLMNAKDFLISDLDDLTIGLLNGCPSFKKFPDWDILADKMAIQYSRLILNEEARELRMKSARINYCIRALLDKDIAVSYVTEWSIKSKGPWDFLYYKGQLLWIDCETNNFKVKNGDEIVSYPCGLPTQLDKLNGHGVAVGSTYTKGGWVFDGEKLSEIYHSEPIVTFFLWGDLICCLDIKGQLIDLSGRKIAEIQLPFSMIHKCRFIEDRLLFFDWSKPNKGFVYYLDTGVGESFHLDSVIICNDICFLSGYYYLIDKEQGFVFKYDKDFVLMDKKSGLGYGNGRLYDPISIKVVDGYIQVLNWFSGKVVVFDVF